MNQTYEYIFSLKERLTIENLNGKLTNLLAILTEMGANVRDIVEEGSDRISAYIDNWAKIPDNSRDYLIQCGYFPSSA